MEMEGLVCRIFLVNGRGPLSVRSVGRTVGQETWRHEGKPEIQGFNVFMTFPPQETDTHEWVKRQNWTNEKPTKGGWY